LTWRVATVARLQPETPSATTLILDVPEWPGHLAGQHIDVRLTAEDGYQAERSYSIASAPQDPHLAITIERIDDGEVSPYLTDELHPGDQLELRGPIGGYFTWEAADGGPLLLLAGGSGLVPLMAMLRHRTAAASDAAATVLVSARSWEDVLYRDELASHDEDGVTVRYTLTRVQPPEWAGWAGARERRHAPRARRRPIGPLRVFVCGPTGFVEHVADLLVQLGATRMPSRPSASDRQGDHDGRNRATHRRQAIAGILQEIFVAEFTTLERTCQSCGDRNPAARTGVTGAPESCCGAHIATMSHFVSLYSPTSTSSSSEAHGVDALRFRGSRAANDFPFPRSSRELGVAVVRQETTGIRPFVNRHHERDWLEERLDDARSGQPQLVLISGEPGIGKSGSSRGAADGFEPRHGGVTGRCRSTSPSVPAFRGIAAPGCSSSPAKTRHWAGTQPSSNDYSATMQRAHRRAGHDPRNTSRHAFVAVAAATIRLAERRPLLVVVDDLHWADRASLDLFTHLALEIADTAMSEPVAVMLAATYRNAASSPLSEDIERLQREEICHQIALRPLPEEEAGEMVRSLRLPDSTRQIEHTVYRRRRQPALHRERRPPARPGRRAKPRGERGCGAEDRRSARDHRCRRRTSRRATGTGAGHAHPRRRRR
jgi:ferredoxin-NADP reductase